MASINGINTNMALKLNAAATAWGTAGAFGGTDKIIALANYPDNAPILAKSGVSSGKQFGSGADKGTPTFNLNLQFVGGQTEEATPPGFQNGFDRCLAQFFGASAAPAEQTASQGDYMHRLTFATATNPSYCTFAIQETSTEVAEMASVAFQTLTIDASNPTSYLSATFDGIASGIESDAPTNSFATIGSQTTPDEEAVVVAPDDDFWLDTQASVALASGDQVNIQGYVLTLNKPQSQKNEIKGSSGSGSPTLDSQYTGELTLSFKELPDHTIVEYWESETYLKCLLNLEGTQIASGVNRSLKFYIPRMKILTRPTYSVTSAGTNIYTATFRLFAASSAPTGMNSTMPYAEVINTRTTVYQA